MKLAVLDLLSFPLGGDMTWLRNFRVGLYREDLPYHAYRFTRPGWSLEAERLPRKNLWAALEVLNGYDAILIPDVNDVNDGTDRAVIKAGGRPAWVELLEALKTPVFAGIHRNCLPNDYGFEFFRDRAAGFFMTTPRFAEGLDIERHPKLTLPYLPYVPGDTIRPDDGDKIVLAGRLFTAKGHRRLALMANMLDGPVELWGASSGTFGGVTEAMRLYAYLGRHGCDPLTPPPVRDEPWIVQNVAQLVYYRGGYTGGYQPYRNARVAVNLTTSKFSPGHLEYVTLEAIDSGVRAVVTESQLDDYPEYEDIIGLASETDDRQAANAINAGYNKPPLSSRERTKILELHDARAYARQLYEWMEETV